MPPRIRLSLVLSLVSAGLMLSIATIRLLRDGSFWLDEASIAVNLIQQTPAELFGPYLTGHSFPRLYLVTIAGLKEIFGYHTMVLRILPYLAFVAGAIAWQRLVFLRLRRQPVVLALVITLNLVPGVWFAYSAMLKQYSLDVLLALVPFLLSDAFFDRHLGAGRSKFKLLPLLALSLLSFTYVIPLLARVLGWVAWRWRRGARAVDPGAAAMFGGGLVVAVAAMWAIDMRHTATSPALFEFWSHCIPSSEPALAPKLFLDYIGGWYRVSPFGARRGLPEALIAVITLFVLVGAAVTLRRSWRGSALDDDAETEWGSRSLCCLICLGGLLAASLLVRYPICPGRLTLFSLFSLQLVMAEGFGALASWLPKTRAWTLAANVALGVLLVLCLPSAHRSARFMMLRDPPENVRPLLPLTESEPELPIVVAACSTKQLSTLPEWMHRDDIVYFDEQVALGRPGLPESGEFWVISAGSRFYCPWFHRGLEAKAESIERLDTVEHTASLVRVRMPMQARP